MHRGLQLTLLLAVVIVAALVVVGRTFRPPSADFAYIERVDLPAAGEMVGLPPVDGPPDASRPLVVLDAGHGGHDPGAGHKGLLEKNLTLQLTRAVRDELLAGGGIRVALTRDDDRYLMLAERSSIARRLGADLFLSIHADSLENGDARGASVYTLSERGTTEAAARIAARENQADAVNGVVLSGMSDTVSAILLDLSQRETQSNSIELARLIVREAEGRLRLHDRAVQSAAFVVLKSPDLASVLFEAGYISNEQDTEFLASEEGQREFARVAARAIRAYLARRSGV